jgi:hypothetical protein
MMIVPFDRSIRLDVLLPYVLAKVSRVRAPEGRPLLNLMASRRSSPRRRRFQRPVNTSHVESDAWPRA